MKIRFCLIVSSVIFVSFTNMFIQKGYTESSEISQETKCGNIWGIKSIIVNEDSLLIEFNPSVPVQVASYINTDGTIGKDVLLYKPFEMKIGEKINWGDGDHVFFSLYLEKIIGSVAFITISDIHRPPPTHENLAYDRSRKCKINGTYYNQTSIDP